MVKKNRIAYGVRVKLNDNFEKKCLGDDYLVDEPVLFIAQEKVYNDTKGDYVHLRGGSLTNSGYAYLDQIDLEFEAPENPLYDLYPDNKEDIPLGMNPRSDKNLLPPHYKYQPEPYFSGKGNHNVKELENLLEEYKEYGHQQALIKQSLITKFEKFNGIIKDLRKRIELLLIVVKHSNENTDDLIIKDSTDDTK